ncbi:MAG: hypothetical protein RLY61_194 [Candidatus Parcubacteria bacterium]|jgi:hypothetical protein
MLKKLLVTIAIILSIVIPTILYWYSKHQYDWVSNYEECLSGRFNLEETSPQRCTLPNGKFFVEDIKTPGDNMKSLPFRTLLTGADIPTMYEERPQENILTFFNDKEPFNAFLAENNIDIREQVDFATNTVVVLFDVLQPTLGYSANLIDYQVLNTGKYVFELQRLVPNSECIQAQAITRPFVIAVIDKMEATEGQIKVKIEEYNPCK